MAFTYQKVKKNADLQQDALKKLESRTDAMDAFEKVMKEEMKNLDSIRSQVADRFKLLRDDRNSMLKKVDNIDNEVAKYRKDIDNYKASMIKEFKQRLNIAENEDVKLGHEIDNVKSIVHGLRQILDQTVSNEVKDIYQRTAAFTERVNKLETDVYNLRLEAVLEKDFYER